MADCFVGAVEVQAVRLGLDILDPMPSTLLGSWLRKVLPLTHLQLALNPYALSVDSNVPAP